MFTRRGGNRCARLQARGDQPGLELRAVDPARARNPIARWGSLLRDGVHDGAWKSSFRVDRITGRLRFISSPWPWQPYERRFNWPWAWRLPNGLIEAAKVVVCTLQDRLHGILPPRLGDHFWLEIKSFKPEPNPLKHFTFQLTTFAA